jgi:asparagine synthase (glutamine-hydrolysing)
MCGIVGWLTSSDAARVTAEPLTRMRDELAHRGPDGDGLWISDDGRVGLGFRRLAIIDLSASANQPMANEDGSIRVLFNGEIYNHATLRRELEGLGHRFRSDHADTETIVHGYEEWGDDVVHHLDGMFAIAVWDGPRRRLLLARDRIGVKPLYLLQAGPHFLFASEMKALFRHPAVSVELEPAAVYHYLTFLSTPAPLTLYRGCLKLPAGYRAVVGPGGALTAEAYWDALPSPAIVDDLARRAPADAFAHAVAETRRRLDRAVEKRLMSDVPFGALLSGGIDSTAIVALMSRFMDRPVRTYTVGFADHQRLNELDEARFVAKTFRTDHHEVLVDERRMREYVPELVYSQDEPIADWVCVPLYFVSKLARDSGTPVVQVGEGSDEQFSGYASYMAYLGLHRRYWQPFRRLPAPLQRAAAWTAQRLARASGRGGLYADIVDRAARDREHFWGGAIAFWESTKRDVAVLSRFGAPPPAGRALAPDSFFDADSFAVVRHHLAEWDRRAAASDVLTRMIYLEFKQRLPELLLMRVDKITMSTSVEARVPFLDKALVEFTMSVPMRLKIGGGAKHLLKQACAGLVPREVIERRKVGFGAPMREWLRGGFGRETEAAIVGSQLAREGYFRYDRIRAMFRLHREGRDFSLPLWTLYNLTACYDRWVAGVRAA